MIDRYLDGDLRAAIETPTQPSGPAPPGRARGTGLQPDRQPLDAARSLSRRIRAMAWPGSIALGVDLAKLVEHRVGQGGEEARLAAARPVLTLRGSGPPIGGGSRSRELVSPPSSGSVPWWRSR